MRIIAKRWLIGSALAVVLASAAGVPAATGAPGGLSRVALPTSAFRSLDENDLSARVRDLFAPGGSSNAVAKARQKCATSLLLEVDARWSELSAEIQAALSAYPIAPRSRGLSSTEAQPLRDQPTSQLVSAHFSIRFALAGEDAVPSADTDGDGFPDYVEAAATALEGSFEAQVERLKWLIPPIENDRYDVVLMNTDADGFASAYGATHWHGYAGDNPNSPGILERYAAYSYIVLSIALTPDQLRVTAAHELCHAVQFGYNGDTSGWDSRRWLMEATSTWMESEVFPSIRDNVYYLRALFSSPDRSITEEDHWYSDWLLLRYISEHQGGPDTIRAIWERGAQMSSHWAFPALVAALAARAATVESVFADFCVANLALVACDVTQSLYCYRDAREYRQVVGGPRIQGRLTVRPPDSSYLPPDGVQPLGVDYVLLSSEAGWMKVGVYGQNPNAAYQARLVAIRGSAVAVWPLRASPSTGTPEVAIAPRGFDAIYVIITDVSAPTRLDWSGYGIVVVAADTPPPTATRAPVSDRMFIPAVLR